MAPEIPEPFFFKSLVADLNHLVGDVTVLRRNRFSDEVARAGGRIGAPVPFGIVSRGASKGR